MSALLDRLQANSALFGGNATFLETLYERYLEDPASVGPEWRSYFDSLRVDHVDRAHRPIQEAIARLAREKRSYPSEGVSPGAGEKQAAVLRLINAYRVRGHQHADLDPLHLRQRPRVPDLDIAFHGLSEADLESLFNTGSLFTAEIRTLREIIDLVHEVYCGTIGAEYMHITDTAQKRWIQERLEGTRARPEFSPETKRWALKLLTAAEGLEKYLHTRYVGQKRFSLEGGESLIPLLDDVVQRAGDSGVHEIIMGMAHRGRLNVLVNILGKAPSLLFQEFEGKPQGLRTASSGDVKYHLGYSSDIETPGGPVHLALAFNPSHLEIISPVVEGSVRARQQRRQDRSGQQVLPVLIHGDAAFAGQGVIMETLNMSQTRGYNTGGTLHIVINNQIGFTTSNPLDARSTLYCTDVAKMVQAPIFHVNGDDPEAVLFVSRIALDFRVRFNKDVVIDLVCYRRHGHNEADDPAVTQPMMYQKIRKHPPTRMRYAERLSSEGITAPDEADEMVANYRNQLDKEHIVSRPILEDAANPYKVDWSPFFETPWDQPTPTAVPPERLRDCCERMLAIPDALELHPRVARIMDDRRKMASGDRLLDWGFAENIAYATLLMEGYPVRLSGQDSGRGTFFHRHAVLHNQKNGESHIPLQHLDPTQGNFVVIDSLLSEEAVLGFEYGYATAEPNALVLWEAQFGDFANNAQVAIDQFIAAGEAKWGRLCSLVLLLPHGYEGQGPEHSSARVERFKQLCAEHNIQLCIPTTPAQMFHLLRRQLLRPSRKPLVVMSPKSLLRHKLSTSKLEELTASAFQPIIGEADQIVSEEVVRLVLCSGKVYFDLLETRRSRGITDVAIIRIEQLYPFPKQGFAAQLEKYPHAKELVWCQEEPQNQGVWDLLKHRFHPYLEAGYKLSYAGRPAAAAPAVGYYTRHIEQQETLVNEALSGRVNPATNKKDKL